MDNMNNMKIYDEIRTPPKEAVKPITGGRLQGKSDINPMWRIEALTRLFGPCGVGWKYEITSTRLEPGADEQVAAFVEVNIYIKNGGDLWSDPIPGVGGNMFIQKEKKGLYTNDDCFKMALSDAIGTACKALGMAADVYWGEATKYTGNGDLAHVTDEEIAQEIDDTNRTSCAVCGENMTQGQIMLSQKKTGKVLCIKCQK